MFLWANWWRKRSLQIASSSRMLWTTWMQLLKQPRTYNLQNFTSHCRKSHTRSSGKDMQLESECHSSWWIRRSMSYSILSANTRGIRSKRLWYIRCLSLIKRRDRLLPLVASWYSRRSIWWHWLFVSQKAQKSSWITLYREPKIAQSKPQRILWCKVICPLRYQEYQLAQESHLLIQPHLQIVLFLWRSSLF